LQTPDEEKNYLTKKGVIGHLFFINTKIKNQLRKTIVTSRKSALKTTLVTILTRVSLIVSLRIIFNQNFVNKC